MIPLMTSHDERMADAFLIPIIMDNMLYNQGRNSVHIQVMRSSLEGETTETEQENRRSEDPRTS